MKLYFETLNEDFNENITTGPVFYTWTEKTDKQPSKFKKEVMGRGTLANTGKAAAWFLELDNPDMYTGHCFR